MSEHLVDIDEDALRSPAPFSSIDICPAAPVRRA
jgi:hypothetical protein